MAAHGLQVVCVMRIMFQAGLNLPRGFHNIIKDWIKRETFEIVPYKYDETGAPSPKKSCCLCAADGTTVVQALWRHRPSGGGLICSPGDALRGQQRRPRQGFPRDCNNSFPMQQQDKLWPFVSLRRRRPCQQHPADHGQHEEYPEHHSCRHGHCCLEPDGHWERQK